MCPFVRITLALSLASALAISVRADVIELANGDRLTGQVITRTDEQIKFEHATLGEIDLPMSQVKAVTLDQPAAPAPGKTPGTAPGKASGPGTAPGTAPAPPEAAEPAKKVAPPAATAKGQAVQKAVVAAAEKEPNPGLLKSVFGDWKTKVALGVNGAAGESDIQSVYFRLNTSHREDRDQWKVSTQWFYSRTDGHTSQNQWTSEVTRDWLQKDSPLFLFVKGQHKYDQFRSWRHRASAFGGAGYTLLDDDAFEVKARLGLGGTYEFGEIDEFTPEALFGGSIMKSDVDQRQTLNGELTWFPALDDEDQHRIVSKLWWTYKLDMLDGLSLKLGLENEYDAQVQNDDNKNDFKYYAALVLEF